MTSTLLSAPLTLPCGVVLPNRLCKAAISEGMADPDGRPTPRLETLYRRWAHSGAGLLLSGNIQVDRQHLERPLNVVAQDDAGLAALTRMAAAGRSGGAQFWAQIAHNRPPGARRHQRRAAGAVQRRDRGDTRCRV